jgi:WD40 repeat protein
MKQLLKWVLAFALPLTLLLAVSASATSTPTRRLMHATGPITALAIDGARVVYSTDGNGVYVWNLQSGVTVRVRKPSPSDFPRIGQVAIAGQRVAWITDDVAGNSMETNENLVTSTLRRDGAQMLAHAFRYWDYVESQPPGRGTWQWRGDWIGGLVGSGDLLAVSTWTTTPDAQTGTEVTSNARLNRVGLASGQLRPIAAGESSIVSRSVDAGQLAVLRSTGTVGIYSSSGALLREITPHPAVEIALTGGRLVVLTKSAQRLEVYNAKSGVLEHSWAINMKRPYPLGNLRAYRRLAVFGVAVGHSDRGIRIFDLQTGRSLALTWRPRSAWTDASVGPLGVVYAVNNGPTGTLVFLSTARVLDGMTRGRLSAPGSDER